MNEPCRTQLNAGVDKSHRNRELVPAHSSRESRRMNNPAIHGVGVDVVRARNIEVARSIRTNRDTRITERASDVHMRRTVTRYETGVFSAPGSLDLRQRIGRTRSARRDYEREKDESRHA